MKRRIFHSMFVLAVLLCLMVPFASQAFASQITLIKETVPPLPNVYNVGDTITFSITVENPVGNPATNTYSLIEDILPNGTHVTLATGVVQAPGVSNTYTTTYVVALADVDPVTHKVTNLVHAIGTDSEGDTVDASTGKSSDINIPPPTTTLIVGGTVYPGNTALVLSLWAGVALAVLAGAVAMARRGQMLKGNSQK